MMGYINICTDEECKSVTQFPSFGDSLYYGKKRLPPLNGEVGSSLVFLNSEGEVGHFDPNGNLYVKGNVVTKNGTCVEVSPPTGIPSESVFLATLLGWVIGGMIVLYKRHRKLEQRFKALADSLNAGGV